MPTHVPWYQSLNGMWKFAFAETPDKRIQNFYEIDYDSGWADMPVPSHWRFKGMTILNIQMLDTPGPNRSLN